MRYTNLAVFAAALACLYTTALVILRSPLLAGVAVLPIVLLPALATDAAFVTQSGDIFMLAALAAVLMVWTLLHKHGKATAWSSVVLLGLLAGVAPSAKHPGALVVIAVCLYLAGHSRGIARVWKPALCGAVAFAAFAALNPIVLYETAPWTACAQMVERRAACAAWYVKRHGPLSWTAYFKGLFFWWPMLPVLLAALWGCRKTWWFGPVAMWGGVLALGVLVGFLAIPLIPSGAPRYLAPLEVALFFPGALAILTLYRARRPAP